MNLLNAIRKIALLVAAALGCAAALAQGSIPNWPQRPIRLIVGFAAGSGADSIARPFGQKLADLLGQPVVVENKPGAGQIVAIHTVRTAAPDGYTLYMGTGSSLSQGPGIRKDLPYDPLKAFTFIGQIGTVAGMVYTHPSVPVHNTAELIAYAKANPNKLSYGSAGVGSAGHLAAEYFMNVTGTKLFHVPFKSDPDTAREVASGNVNMGFTLARAMAPLADSNKLTPVMVIGNKRVPYLPNVQDGAEVKVAGLESMGPFTYYGIVGPAGMPAAIVEKINRAINQANASPDVNAQLQNAYLEFANWTPREFQAFVEKEISKWRKVGETVKIEF